MSAQLLTAAASNVQPLDEGLKIIFISGFIINFILFAALIYLIYRLTKLKKSKGIVVKPAVRSRSNNDATQSVDQVIEKRVLALASKRGGILSVVETAYYTKLSIEVAEVALESFTQRGFAEIKDSMGANLYHFQGILSEDEKVNAQSLDDLLHE